MPGGNSRNITRHGACQVDRRLPGQLSDQQINDAFRAAQLSPKEVEGFTKKAREKINELQQL